MERGKKGRGDTHRVSTGATIIRIIREIGLTSIRHITITVPKPSIARYGTIPVRTGRRAIARRTYVATRAAIKDVCFQIDLTAV